MRRAEGWVPWDDMFAVVMTIVIIAALFYSFHARAEAAHSREHQVTHGAYHHIDNRIVRPDLDNSSCSGEQDSAPSEVK
jgi:hypothetical protein